MPALMAAATFRIGLIMERGLMRQGSALAPSTPACGAGMDASLQTHDVEHERKWADWFCARLVIAFAIRRASAVVGFG